MARLPASVAIGALLLLVVGSHADSNCPQSCPPKLPAASGLTSCKVVIVGGGSGGLFSAWFLRSLGADVCVVEKAPVYNGRIRDIPFNPDPNVKNPNPKVFNRCAQRVNEAQLDMRCIVHELNVTLQEAGFDTINYSRAKLARATRHFLGADGAYPRVRAAANSTSEGDLETALIEFALVVSTEINPLTGVKAAPHPATKCGQFPTVRAYLIDTFGSEVAQWLLSMASFRGDLTTPLDVCEYIQFFKADWDRCCTNFYPVGGWSAILGKLRWQASNKRVRPMIIAAVTQSTNHRLITHLSHFNKSEITCVYKTPAGKYIASMANGKGWIADRLMFNGGPLDAVKLGGNLGAQLATSEVIKSITPIEVVTYNAFYPNRFWEALATVAGQNFRYITDARCTSRSEFPGHEYVQDINASRPIYTDDPRCIAEYKALYNFGGLPAIRAQVTEDMRKMFPGVAIPQPLQDFFHVSTNAWHYVGPFASHKNITIASIFDWARVPFGDTHFCLVGEPYAIQSSGWVHAAYLSVANCVQHNMLDLLPAAEAAGVKAKIEYYASGCGGMPTPFSNEIMSRKDIKLPGADLMLGEEADKVAALPIKALLTRKQQRERFRV